MKHKKTILILLTCLLLLCTSCSESRRFGMQELSRRVGETDERFAFSTDGISLSNGFYHIPFSVSQENDLLLSLGKSSTCVCERSFLFQNTDPVGCLFS